MLLLLVAPGTARGELSGDPVEILPTATCRVVVGVDADVDVGAIVVVLVVVEVINFESGLQIR